MAARAPLPIAQDRPAGGLLQGRLPVACAMCTAGAKLVVFLTGECHYRCWYCPVSAERRMKPQMYANEKPVAEGDLESVAREAELMKAGGTGITGGDPMYQPQTVIALVRFLKQRFGAKHNVHLYTQIDFDPAWLPRLAEAGLDEIRFHPWPEHWTRPHDSHHARLIPLALKTPMKVSVEIPALPGMAEETCTLLSWLQGLGVRHVNLNELEFSPTNTEALVTRGIEPLDDETERAKGSREVAVEVLRRFASSPLSVHFCTSPFKDAIQMRNRLRRRAGSVAKPWEVMTEEGTLVRGLIAPRDGGDEATPATIAETLRTKHAVPHDLLQAEKGRVYVAPWLLERFAKQLPWPAYLSEVYPTDTALEVEREPLNAAARGGDASARRGARL